MMWLRNNGYPQATISYQFAQVGNDEKVETWFKRLDNLDPIGEVIDCTSRYEAESAQAGADGLTVEEYMLKL
jgi:hypothetical protein